VAVRLERPTESVPQRIRRVLLRMGFVWGGEGQTVANEGDCKPDAVRDADFPSADMEFGRVSGPGLGSDRAAEKIESDASASCTIWSTVIGILRRKLKAF